MAGKTSHLHEVLAVDKELEQAAGKIVEEAKVTFSKKADLFTGHSKTYEFFTEGREQEALGLAERKELTTTVPDKLDYVVMHLVRFIDALSQKEATNQVAKGDIILDGEIFAKDIPATLLLALENKIAKLRQMYEMIPTLQPGVEWIPAPTLGKNIYQAKNNIIRHRTEKVLRVKVMVDATDKHPAQVKDWWEDVPIGQSTSVAWSGMITPAQKSAVLKRLDDLVYAIKQARMRANETEVVEIHLGQALFNYIHEGLKEGQIE